MTDNKLPEGEWPEASPPAVLPAACADSSPSREAVWFSLFKLNNLLTRPFFTRFAEKYQISLTDWRIIVMLAAMSEAAAHELCDATGMHPMNVSRSVAALRRQGRVSERRDPANRRRKIITLTADGWTLYEGLSPHLRQFSKFLFGSMPAAEIELFTRLIDLLTARVESVGPDSPVLFDQAALAHQPPAPAARRKRPRRLDE